MIKPLAGRKIAILVESQFIPVELKVYQETFERWGATVHFITRLWNQPKMRLVSEVEQEGKIPEVFEVNIDLEKVCPSDYDAVLMAANYTSVRLRYFGPPHDRRNTPAVKFFADAMRNPRIIKGALCHGLWILTPRPELLAGRKVICHEVLEADVYNAGGEIVAAPGNVVVDDDLVTGKTYLEAGGLAEAIKNQILLATKADTPPWAPKNEHFHFDKMPTTRRKILAVLSEWGYWGEELVGPLEVFDAVGYKTDFVTPTGKRPIAIAVSMDPENLDPPLGRSVTSHEMAKKVLAWDDPLTDEGKRLENPINLSEWFPDRPYWSAPQFLRASERYHAKLAEAELSIEPYDALLIVGGSGPLVDLCNNHRVHDLLLSFYRAGKPIAAECYGVTCLAFARDLNDRKSIIWGKHVTGHCKEYDFKDGTGFMKARGQFLDFNMGPPPYPLEYILRDATGPDGAFHGNVGHPTSVIVDYPFITGRSTPDSYLTGQKLVEVLDGDPPLRRWGW
ncbi:DJ-1/PfpI family protein [Blastopirellula marina]|uniref:Thiamine biosynthesis protein ThiJ n=1 Tax=Blastopirellula marina TaxID=124 RepID=A0A2S8G9E7_9BACT|nr:DJ-1/PfpI family protein [Blastopirellula marina]PQO41053.1 thiamine biosynthesis protein ThiJ [Blastopirellula marina]PTL45929.1 thiamine biosynthesis protein ThiJ [Blastopirellula marina]